MRIQSMLALSALVLSIFAPRAARADEPEGAPSPAPESEVDRTVFDSKTRHGGYGAPETKITTMTGDAAVLVGGQGGWIINRHFIIGGAGYGLASRHTPDMQLQRPTGASRIELGYGGPRVAYVFQPASLVHLTVGVLVGAGALTIATRAPANDDGFDHHDSAGFFALEPQAEMDINLAKFVRLALGGSYRYLGSSGKPGLAASDLSGPAGSIAIKLGVF